MKNNRKYRQQTTYYAFSTLILLLFVFFSFYSYATLSFGHLQNWRQIIAQITKEIK